MAARSAPLFGLTVNSMKCLVFIAPNDFKDESLKMLQTFFDRWGVNYKVTSYSKKECIGYHGMRCNPDVNTGTVNASDYDGIFLVDGRGFETYNLYDYRPLLDLLFNFNRQGKFVCGVGNAIKALARANIIKAKKITVPDDDTKKLILLFHGVPSEGSSEAADNIYTIKDSQSIPDALPTIFARLGIK